MITLTEGAVQQRLDIFPNQNLDECRISAEYANVDGYAQFKPDDKFNRALVKLAKMFPGIMKIEFVSSETPCAKPLAKKDIVSPRIGNYSYIRIISHKENNLVHYNMYIYIKKHNSLPECFTQGPSDAMRLLLTQPGKQTIRGLLTPKKSKKHTIPPEPGFPGAAIWLTELCRQSK